VRLLQAAGREVIVLGDINIVRAPIDSGEGGIKTTAAQHYEHPARRILDDWCAPKGPMIDVVRESWPDREDMFTVWNQKLDARLACSGRFVCTTNARASNYGSRIDLILCTPGLRPWIKGGDIQASVYGSDHCPVYIDLHESIALEDGTVQQLRDQLNPPNRELSTAPNYPNDVPRIALEPPRFATKFFDEFSARQRTLKSFFGGKKLVEPSPPPAPETIAPALRVEKTASSDDRPKPSLRHPSPDDSLSSPFAIAQAAFEAIEAGPSQPRTTTKSPSLPIDMTADDISHVTPTRTKPKSKQIKPVNSQTRISAFFAQPPSSTKRKQSATPERLPRAASPSASPVDVISTSTSEDDALIAQAIAEADEEKASKRAKANAEAAPVWSNLFAKKLPPFCIVHQKPCKDFSESSIERRVISQFQSPKCPDQTKGSGSGCVHCEWFGFAA